MQIHEIMTHPVQTVKANATVHHAAEMMALHDVGALPVCENDRVVGIITDRDIVLRCLAQGRNPATEVYRIMTPGPGRPLARCIGGRGRPHLHQPATTPLTDRR